MKATRPIKSGEQIFNDYGPLPRSDLLRMYGYATDNYAKYDVVEFSYDLLEEMAGKKQDKNNKEWLKRKDALDEIGLIEDGYALARPETDSKLHDVVPEELHMLLRAMCSNDKIPKDKPKDPISLEEAALLSATLTKRLADFATSAEDDGRILAQLRNNENISMPQDVSMHRYRMAVEVRKGEKEVLSQLMGLCQDHIGAMADKITNGGEKRKHEDDSLNQPKKAARTART